MPKALKSEPGFWLMEAATEVMSLALLRVVWPPPWCRLALLVWCRACCIWGSVGQFEVFKTLYKTECCFLKQVSRENLK